MKSLRDFLKDKGISPSYQRLKILEYLKQNHVHPTVDMIYGELCDEIPTLSKTTIYNTLNLFAEKGIVNTVIIEGNEVRFDINTYPHGHFKCINCGKVYDVKLSESLFRKETINGHKINEFHFYFKGVCKVCQKEAKSKLMEEN